MLCDCTYDSPRACASPTKRKRHFGNRTHAIAWNTVKYVSPTVVTLGEMVLAAVPPTYTKMHWQLECNFTTSRVKMLHYQCLKENLVFTRIYTRGVIILGSFRSLWKRTVKYRCIIMNTNYCRCFKDSLWIIYIDAEIKESLEIENILWSLAMAPNIINYYFIHSTLIG